MRLRQLRECYRLADDGVTWIPKTRFATEEAALNTEIKEDWYPYAYLCNVCSKWHIANLNKKEDRKGVDRTGA